MLFSILIANYNNEKWVELSVESALNQNFDFKEFEVIVCDDASTDNSLNCILKYTDRIKILENKRNFGVGYTKKKLIENSVGKYFLFLDSDDYVLEDCLTQLHSYISVIQKDFSIIYGQSQFLKLDGTIVNCKRSKIIKENLFFDTFNYPVFHPVLFVRNAYNKTQGMLQYLRCAEDFDLWYKHEEVGKLLFFDYVLYVVRERADSLTFTDNNLKKWTANMLYQYYVGLNAANRRGANSHAFTELVAELILNRFERDLHKKKSNKLFLFFIKVKRKLKYIFIYGFLQIKKYT